MWTVFGAQQAVMTLSEALLPGMKVVVRLAGMARVLNSGSEFPPGGQVVLVDMSMAACGCSKKEGLFAVERKVNWTF